MQHPDEGMIHTWLDGELPAEEAAALEEHAATCEQCKAAIAEARGFIAASSRIVSSLDAVPAGVIPMVKKPAKGRWYTSVQFRAAAAVLVVAGASLVVMRDGTEKATMAVSRGAEASDALNSQRAIAESDSSPPSRSTTVQPPVVADQAAAKEQAAKAVAPQVATVMGARVVRIPRVDVQKPVTNEADFSGKGVKGGTAYGVAGGVPMRDTAAIASAQTMKASGAPSARAAFAAQPELKVLHADSSGLVKNTIYQSLSGKQVVLTERPAEISLSEVMITGAPSQARKSAAQTAPIRANAPVAPVPAAPAPAPAVQSEDSVHTITWMDPSTRRRYILSGPVSVQELEAIKARILQIRD